MPNTHETLVGLFGDIADAIRQKDGTAADIVADNFPARILAIPSGGITPTGTKQITQAGETDVTEFAKANVPNASLSLNTPSVNSSGLVTASAALTSAGWQGSAPQSKTLQLTTQAGKTVTPTESEQTAINSGIYTTGVVKVAAIQTETKTAALDMASGNQVVQNTGGKYMKQVTITKPATLIPGNIKKDVNIGGVVGTMESGGGSTRIVPTSDTWQHNQYVTLTLDVDAEGNLTIEQTAGAGTTTNLHICYPQGSSTTVTKIPNVPTTPGTYTFPFTAVWDGDSNDHTLTYTVTDGQITVEALSVTANGTYTASAGKAYSPVTVNVSGGGGKNIQYYAGLQSIAKTSLSSTDVKVTVEKTGNYKISWMAARGSSSGTMSTRLYVNGSAKDTDRTTWTQTYGQQITINSFALTAGQTVEIYARSGSTSRYVMVGQLVIEEL